jgi:hypothetical protein
VLPKCSIDASDCIPSVATSPFRRNGTTATVAGLCTSRCPVKSLQAATHDALLVDSKILVGDRHCMPAAPTPVHSCDLRPMALVFCKANCTDQFFGLMLRRIHLKPRESASSREDPASSTLSLCRVVNAIAARLRVVLFRGSSFPSYRVG